MNTTHLFLDLEDTIVKPLGLGRVPVFELNMPGILTAKRLIIEHQVTSVSIFSFALLHQEDVDMFNRFGKGKIENALGFPLTMVPSCLEITRQVATSLMLHPDKCEFSDICDFLGKGDSFKHFAKNLDTHNKFILLDDNVDNSTTTFTNNKVVITLRFNND